MLLHLRRRNLDFLHTYIHTYIHTTSNPCCAVVGLYPTEQKASKATTKSVQVSEIHSRQRLRSASSTDVVVPATRRSSLGDRAFRSQELGHGTRYRPVSPPGRLSLFIPTISENFSVAAINCTDNINYGVVVPKCSNSAPR